ncbi:DUF433 domain-containing protein [Dolichospermum sp. LEGE 00240]|uniref:DUF433 domain-containing protein n=1 Tax=Dolichospermum sp. LEGE 00240 TaxID=1828603 RepID=UPI0018813373|nr:DUF433 domain-containing protein [Dolichospermum sp. LEGE 00240]MDM3843535.1 DUF433 domain-containing protein [Aphanizomenon gracile PMC638.10]MDM3848943.1 DUF433 domain-containing protein [Aphanizomenon gracile PMC627.10]MDM3854187.1 DUF433 domain-containing protein [Aphanizomenon gracile PMC649.10]MDM3860135.1 DUF433 domain-containing protein [Aphanizomenon gracile PMC644.10]MBE9250791.1 DUF433 domain-containing protein [Dolichospermum sp. LEGE 00240]
MENNLDKYIEVTPGIRSGKPRITGTRITVADVAIMYLRMGHSLEEIAGKYQLSLVSVHTAMAFYYEHRQEIDQQIADAEAYAEAERLNSPSLLQEKLNAMKKYA